MQPIEFRAPWGRALKLATAFSLVVLGVVFAIGVRSVQMNAPWIASAVLVGAPLCIALCAIPFMVRGYVLTDREIIVRRVGFETRLPLAGLKSVAGDVDAMARSFRLFGNGGLLSFTGEFWNSRLGRFRALATDPSRAVVLKYHKRAIVITPHDPQQFIMRARTALKFVDSGRAAAPDA